MNADDAILQALYAARTPELVQLFSLITHLGGASIVIGVTLLVAALFFTRGMWGATMGLLVSVAGGSVAGYIIKEIAARARPPAPYQAILETGYSFPSNHSIAAIALYGFLAYLIWKHLPKPFNISSTVASCIIIIAIGFSRVYLGVHYPSDVLGGFLIGGIFLWLGIALMRKLEPAENTGLRLTSENRL